MDTVHRAIHANVEIGATIHSDEASAYGNLDGLFFRHEHINHSAGEYARGSVTTNSVESVFAVMKRGVLGVYHHTSRNKKPEMLARAFRLQRCAGLGANPSIKA